MLKTVMLLPDGTELSSGIGAENAIVSATVTQSVNAGSELTLGSCCAAMLEAKLITPKGKLSVNAGQEVTLFREDEKGARQKVGIFIAEKPTHPSANAMTLTAYDRVVRLDKDLSDWLWKLDRWPYTLQELAEQVCAACNLELTGQELPNGGYIVEKFSASGTTGRQLMGWIGQIAGRFCRATPQGQIEFAWYTPADITLGPEQIPVAKAVYLDGELSIKDHSAVTGEDADGIFIQSEHLRLTDDGAGNTDLQLSDRLMQQYYFQNGLSFEDYTAAPIEKVQLRQSDSDVGEVYPDVQGEKNTYIFSGNPLLTGASGEKLQPVAKALYNQLKAVSYTPCRVKLPAGSDLQAGQILQIKDGNGKKLTVYAMELTQNATVTNLVCVGSAKRNSTTAVNRQNYENLAGKVLNLQTDVDGFRVENSDNAGKLARLEVDVDGIRSQAQTQKETTDGLQTQLTALEQTASSISAKVKTITENGTNKLTTEFGLTIDGSAVTISRSDSDMENKLNEKGMYIVRDANTDNQTVMLRADADGVLATDVAVRNYLTIGDHARFEDYPDNRTACFWIGG